MDASAALTRLGRLLSYSTDPALTTAELADLLAMSRLADSDGNAPDSYADWAVGTVYALGAVVVPTTRNGHYYTCTTAGTSHATTQPTWPTTSGGTVTDFGTLVWTESGSAPWTPTYDLNRGAAEGWRWKAAKASARFDFDADGGNFKRSQVAARCLEMAKAYARKVASNICLPGALATED